MAECDGNGFGIKSGENEAAIILEDEVRRSMVVSDPEIMMGKPVIEGTRITVESILEKLSEGESVEQIVDEHPRLTEEGVRAALAFAGEALKADVVYPLEEKPA